MCRQVLRAIPVLRVPQINRADVERGGYRYPGAAVDERLYEVDRYRDRRTGSHRRARCGHRSAVGASMAVATATRTRMAS